MKRTMKYWGRCLMMAVLLSGGSSCIRDRLDPCPPLSIKLEVKDKNYMNIDKVLDLDTKRPENLPFKEYIPTLFYSLTDANTGEEIEEQGVFQVEGDELAFQLPICGACLPHGRYALTVWGGLHDLTQLSDDRTRLQLHTGHHTGSDVYVAQDTIVYDYRHGNYVLQMERVKGKLIVLMEGMKPEVKSMKQSISHVSSQVDAGLHYAGKTYVEQRTDRLDAPTVRMEGIVSQSAEVKTSHFDVTFYDAQQQELTAIKPAGATVDIWRNSISALKYVLQSDGEYAVYVLMNDSWRQVHDMDI